MRNLWLRCPGQKIRIHFIRHASTCAIFLFFILMWQRNSLIFRSDDTSTLKSFSHTVYTHTYRENNTNVLDSVGLSELRYSDCPGRAFNASANNAHFAQMVHRISEDKIVEDAAKDCGNFLRQYGFTRYPPASAEEKEFPLAFILLFHKDLDQILYLLRAIYQPHNTYCLSVDLNSAPIFIEKVRKVVSCIPNVFLASHMTHIVYAGFTRLEADIHCMEDLLRSPIQWRYVINMAGQQFPLRTNLEMVRILSMFNGTNDVEGLGAGRTLPQRYNFKHKYVMNEKTGKLDIIRTSERHQPPPHNLQIVKGSAYGSFSRAFVDFVINDQIAKDLLEWGKSVYSPDEYFWAILHHSKTVDVPGRYTGPLNTKKWFTVFASWGGENSCATIRVRGVCIFSPEDLPLLSRRPEFFANKFYITHHPGALHCLDQLMYNLTLSRTVRDLSVFRSMPFVKKDIR